MPDLFRLFDDLADNGVLAVPGGATLPRHAAAADLAALGAIIRGRHSYAMAVAFPFEAALRHMTERLPERVCVGGLTVQVQKLIQHLGDSHAQVPGWRDLLPRRYSPVRIGIEGNLGFAFWPDRRQLVDPGHPHIRAIDGLPLAQWLDRAGDIASGPYASRSQRLVRALEMMRYVGYMRRELGLADAPEITFELVSADGEAARTVAVPVVGTLEHDGKAFHLPGQSRLMDGGIGYLRIHSQDDKALSASLDGWMQRFHDTRALIVDARQCGGGTRDNLDALFPYLMAPEDGVYIPNVAKLRIPAGVADFDPTDQLKVADKAMQYRRDPTTPSAHAQALAAFLARFTPQWQPPENQFTDWYFSAYEALPGKPFYDRPVYVLMDWGAGSAGDIFLSTFKSWRNVTLVGTPSNGRSGNSIPFVLPHSGIAARLSTMASFQKTGELYDGVGVAPDIVMEAVMSDWLGETDTILDRVRTMAVA